jgi:hypothetical protein
MGWRDSIGIGVLQQLGVGQVVLDEVKCSEIYLLLGIMVKTALAS